jgi:hypothetical protein
MTLTGPPVCYRTYRQLDDALPALVQELLSKSSDGLWRRHGYWVRSDNAEQDLVIVRDIAEQDSYRIAELEVPGPIAVDVGAHIGVFSGAFKRRHPSARVVAVECCPENIDALKRNIGDFATIIPAAMTYERDVALLNAVYPHCISTGGSRVVARSELDSFPPLPPHPQAGTRGRGEGAWHCSDASTSPAVSPSLPLSVSPSSLTEYWPDTRPLPTVTLEQIIAEHHLDRIDVLKLDCEGSEFSILENTTSLDSIGAIVGEYHGRERFLELVARRFADWQFRILREGDPGTFWLVRKGETEPPADNPKSKIQNPKSKGRPSSDTDAFWTRFLAIVHPLDQPVPDAWRQYYGTLFDLARELRPRRVCEIGVRAGYSAFAILSANPNAVMLGVDADVDEATHNSHNGRKGLYRHAEKIVAPFNYQLLVADSHVLARLPRCDLVYLDGEHTLEGCLADLHLAERSTDRILVDDYDSIPSVREACDRFAAERPGFATRYIANGLTGFLLLERRSQQTKGDQR